MIIRRLHVENYKNLKNVELELKQLNIFVGPNGSGKTNLLELLWKFSSEFTITGGASSLDEDSWWKRTPRNPIKIELEIELENDEQQKLPKEFRKLLQIVQREKSQSPAFIVRIIREVKKPKAKWSTVLLKFNGLELVRDDKVTQLININKMLKKEVKKAAKAILFDPKASKQNLIGPRLVVLGNKAYHMDSKLDEFVREGIIPYEKIPVSVDYKEWCKNEGLELIERPPTEEELKDYIFPITQRQLNEVLNNIQKMIRNLFIYFPAARNIRLGPGERKIIVGEELAKTSFLLKPETPESYRKFRYVEEKFKEIYKSTKDELRDLYNPSEKSIRSLGEEVRIDDRSAEGIISIAFQGGGEQEVLNLLVMLVSTERGKIIIIEEPELHLHPALCRGVFKLFKERVKQNQLIIATHSPEFICKGDNICTNFWFNLKIDGSVEVSPKKANELISILRGLGVTPSSGGAPEKIVAVEGPSDLEFIRIISEKLGATRLNLLTMIGAKNYEFLERLSEGLRATLITLYVITDKDRKKNIEKLIQKGILDPNKVFTIDPDLECIYPQELLKKALINTFKINEEKAKEISEAKNKQRKKLLEKQLKRIDKEWKISLARTIAQLIDPRDILSKKADYDDLADLITFIQRVIAET